METERVSWLQISDLHILLHSPSWEDYKNAMFRFFENDPEKKPDFVVITGDYCNIRKKESYELAEDFIRKLMELLGLSVSKDLFMIPGNHDTLPQQNSGTAQDRRTNDLQRLLPDGLSPWEKVEDEKAWLEKSKTDPADYLDRLCGVTRDHAENENAVLIPVLLKGFEQYQRMVKRLIPWYTNSGWQPESPHVRKWETGSGLGLNIVHLNTALVADGSRSHYQALDLNNAKDIFYNIKTGLPTLVLAHNSFYDLHPEIQDQLKQPMLAARVCAWLCGDVHIFDTDESIPCPTDSGTYSIPIFVCGKGAPDHKDDYSQNGFFLYQLGEKELTSQRFMWSLERGFLGETEKTEPLADPRSPTAASGEPMRLLIGYLSCNPDCKAEEKYHLGHAYFIHCIDQRRTGNNNVMLLTSSYVFTRNRNLRSIQDEAKYVEEMIQRWEDCFDRQVKVLDIKQYLQEENPLDDNEKRLLYYITQMEMMLDRNPEWMNFIDNWNRTGKINEIAYEAITKVVGMEDHPDAYTENEVMSFIYLLYKRPAWYSNAWLVNFLHFWNAQLYPLIKDTFGIDVDANDIFIVEARRNHYVWDAISYCAKRFSYTNVPKVEYLENLLDMDCRQPMKSSDRDKAVFLAGHAEKINFGRRFKAHIAEMFGDEKSPDEIVKEYSGRLGLER